MMRCVMKRFVFLVAVAIAANASMLGSALATDPVGWTRTILAGPIAFGEIDVKSHTDKHFAVIETGGLSDVYMVEFTVAPGGHSGWHSHPGVTIITVNSGAATEYHGDDPNCTPLVYQAGSGFTVEAGDNYIIRNEGSTDLQLFALFLVPSGQAFRIDEPDPGHCP
jgi:quercetin dioxygenase-like cupin family protein